MTRQERFEAMWADRHAVPVETMAQYRFKDSDGYRLPDMAAHYRTFCAAIETVQGGVPMIMIGDRAGTMAIQFRRGMDGPIHSLLINPYNWTCLGAV